MNKEELFKEIEVQIKDGKLDPDDLGDFIPVCMTCVYKSIFGLVFIAGLCIFIGTLI